MAQIPGPDGLGQLRPQARSMVVQGGSDAVAQGAQHLASRISQIGEDAAQRQEEADRLKTAASLSQYETQMQVLRQKVQNDLTGGAIGSREDALKQFQQQAEDMTSSLYDTVPKKLRDAARVKGDQVLAAQSMGMGEFLDQHATQEARGNLGVLRQSLITQGLADENSLTAAKDQYRLAVEANARALRFSPEDSAKQLTDFAGDATFGHFSQQMAERPGDIKYIRQLKARLSDEKQLTDLDQPHRTQLLHTANSLEEQWLAEQRRLKNESEARMATDAEEVRSFLLGGGDITKLPPSDRRRFSAVQSSDKYGGKFKGWLQTNLDVAKLNGLPIKEQQNQILEAEARLQKTNGLEAYNDARDTLAALQQNASRNLQAFKADPLNYTATTLLKEDVKPINWTDSASLPDQLRQRREQASRASKMNGTKVPPVTASDAATIAQITNAMPPQEGAKFLGLVADAIGVESMPQVTALMSNNGDPAIVGAAALAGHVSSEGRPVSALVLRGRDVLKNKEVKMPEETKLRASFAAGTGMSGPPMEMAFQTTLAIYAARAREEGVTEPSSGQPDQRLWRQSVALATGGVYDYKGQKLLAPRYGMSQADFEDRLDQIKPDDIQRDAGGKKLYVNGQEISYDKALSYLRQAPLGNGDREGAVWVRAGSGMIMQEDGSPLMVTVPSSTNPGKRAPMRVNTTMMTPGM